MTLADLSPPGWSFRPLGVLPAAPPPSPTPAARVPSPGAATTARPGAVPDPSRAAWRPS